MPTNIAVVRNESARSILAFNSENIGNSFMLNPKAQQPPQPNGVWISWHADKPLVVMTTKGVCRLWDSDWKIHGRWEGSSNEVIFLSGQAAGVGGNLRLNVNAAGDLAFIKI